MPRSFRGRADSPTAVADIHGAFAREEYWAARLATGGPGTTLNSLVVGDDGAVAVRYTQQVGRQLLPAAVAGLVPGEVRMEYTESWSPVERGQADGRIDVTVSGNLGSCRANTWLEPAGRGSRLRFEGTVKVRIPLVGGSLEKAIGAELAASVPSVMCFTTTWIADNA
ncbi:DUF2505 domain-containing protein [Mycobacterium sp. WMMD1722]|uniref:DUF2505 domain-containing protein n=1 Tax=Mycobacterium sp. WMMD1722 TaxID=3404117 RepID=UPI003BF5BE12